MFTHLSDEMVELVVSKFIQTLKVFDSMKIQLERIVVLLPHASLSLKSKIMKYRNIPC